MGKTKDENLINWKTGDHFHHSESVIEADLAKQKTHVIENKSWNLFGLPIRQKTTVSNLNADLLIATMS